MTPLMPPSAMAVAQRVGMVLATTQTRALGLASMAETAARRPAPPEPMTMMSKSSMGLLLAAHREEPNPPRPKVKVRAPAVTTEALMKVRRFMNSFFSDIVSSRCNRQRGNIYVLAFNKFCAKKCKCVCAVQTMNPACQNFLIKTLCYEYFCGSVPYAAAPALVEQ